jgi:hypothetical protein
MRVLFHYSVSSLAHAVLTSGRLLALSVWFWVKQWPVSMYVVVYSLVAAVVTSLVVRFAPDALSDSDTYVLSPVYTLLMFVVGFVFQSSFDQSRDIQRNVQELQAHVWSLWSILKPDATNQPSGLPGLFAQEVSRDLHHSLTLSVNNGRAERDPGRLDGYPVLHRVLDRLSLTCTLAACSAIDSPEDQAWNRHAVLLLRQFRLTYQPYTDDVQTFIEAVRDIVVRIQAVRANRIATFQSKFSMAITSLCAYYTAFVLPIVLAGLFGYWAILVNAVAGLPVLLVLNVGFATDPFDPGDRENVVVQELQHNHELLEYACRPEATGNAVTPLRMLQLASTSFG